MQQTQFTAIIKGTMKKLPSMTEYVMWLFSQDIKDIILEEKSWREIRLYQILDYAQLLQYPLSLGQFIPCDSKGNPIEKPEHKNPGHSTFEMHQVQEYQEAVDRVIFEGWESVPDIVSNYKGGGVYSQKVGYIDGRMKYKTIEDAITAKIELHLKDKPAKELGLTFQKSLGV